MQKSLNFAMFSKTPSSSSGCHFQTKGATDLGLVSFWSIFYLLFIKGKKYSQKRRIRLHFKKKHKDNNKFLPQIFHWIISWLFKNPNEYYHYFMCVIYVQTASICNQSQLSSSIRSKMTDRQRWKGQKQFFEVEWLLSDICLKFNFFENQR